VVDSKNSYASRKTVTGGRGCQKTIIAVGTSPGSPSSPERDLKAAQVVETELREKVIPGLMDELGMQAFETQSGFTIRIVENVFANISEERKAAAHAWLDKNGHGGMIRRKVLVEFNREQGEDAKQLATDLHGKYPAVSQEMAVNGNTLKAWAKRMLEDGEDIPLSLFGVHTQKVAKIGK
jgi:hypothetical protein